MPKMVDITGQRYGRLVAIKREGSKNGHVAWRCKCDCGNEIVTRSCDLRNGKSISCGCFHNEMVSNITRSHEKCDTRLYSIYHGMKWRCFCEKASCYMDYGGRGITICDEWLGKDGFKHFYDWAMSHGYADNLSIDRIDVNGNYCPENCRWLNNKRQCNNKRNNRLISFNGETHTAMEWSEITGINYGTLKNRLDKYGWTVERALTEKARGS